MSLVDPPLTALGVGSYRAYVYERNLVERVIEIPFTSLSCNRIIDGTSTASVSAAGGAIDNAGNLPVLRSEIESWKHSLVIYRNGERVWSGPITNWKMSATGVLEASASDVSVWIKRRLIHHDHTFKQVDLATIAQAIIDDAMEVDNVPGLVAAPTNTGVKGDRTYKADQYLNAGDEIDELARTGLDWTAIDQTIIAGNFEIPASPIAYLTGSFFAEGIEVEEVGTALGTTWVVLGGSTGDDGPTIVGKARGGDTAVYGVHERVVSETSIEDQASANLAAATRRDLYSKNPMVFGGGDLDPTAPVTAASLIPGRIVRVLMTVNNRDIRDDFRIKTVTFSADDSGSSESIECEPVGTVGIEEVNG